MAASATAIPDAIRRQLGVGERIFWHGKPIGGLRLRPRDAWFIPFSLLWCGFVAYCGKDDRTAMATWYPSLAVAVRLTAASTDAEKVADGQSRFHSI